MSLPKPVVCLAAVLLAAPIPNDGDGRTDLAVYQRESGLWFVRNSTTQTTTTLAYGGAGYAPVN